MGKYIYTSYEITNAHTDISYLAIIHRAKKEAGKDCRVFGLGIDGHDFNFMAIDENSKVPVFHRLEILRMLTVSSTTCCGRTGWSIQIRSTSSH